MNGLITRRAARMLAVCALALAAAGAGAGGAQAASARPQIPIGCDPAVHTLNGNSSYVVATYTETCHQLNGGYTIINFPVNLLEMVDGTWVVVANGSGVVEHLCVGTTAHEYTSVGVTATFPCG